LKNSKIYHLEKNGLHSYYGSLQAVFNANDDLGVAISTLQHYHWNKNEYSNSKMILRRGVCLSASEAKKF
jgi:hypothetical protein